MSRQIAGAPGRNGLAEAEQRRRDHEERVPAWWDADGWARYRRDLGLPALDTNEED